MTTHPSDKEGSGGAAPVPDRRLRGVKTALVLVLAGAGCALIGGSVLASRMYLEAVRRSAQVRVDAPAVLQRMMRIQTVQVGFHDRLGRYATSLEELVRFDPGLDDKPPNDYVFAVTGTGSSYEIVAEPADRNRDQRKPPRMSFRFDQNGRFRSYWSGH